MQYTIVFIKTIKIMDVTHDGRLRRVLLSKFLVEIVKNI